LGKLDSAEAAEPGCDGGTTPGPKSRDDTRQAVRRLIELRVAQRALIADRELVAAAGAATGQHGPAILGFHAGAEAMRFRTLMVIRLESSLRHLLPLIPPLLWGETSLYALTGRVVRRGTKIPSAREG
jgi:hypothetical protein